MDISGIYITKALSSGLLAYCVIRVIAPPTTISAATASDAHDPVSSSTKPRDSVSLLATPTALRVVLNTVRILFPLLTVLYVAQSSAVREPWSLAEVLALATGAFGGWLRVASYRALDKFFTYRLTIQKDHTLVQTGPYKYLLHPSYTALVLTGLGYVAFHRSSPILASAWLFVSLTALAVRLTEEEAALAEHFGEAWKRHAAERWRLIPGIW
ncbi:uncharacterized protein EV422DRAFT_315369 [Fimicolochytrium jonesii]|uniref:uncharacterized protein n=1 Tax=Fimicolochytrium jonesii TaxID=1396493 RepID=UPI0022FE428A|nr:uncharacterized protein EV422DRAFT_315369 [Fimicolochytrium jonesii]KAI8824290.1 hypothetical protein EV422DRAFT_315369 [Fimicolochytrium jonesii]